MPAIAQSHPIRPQRAARGLNLRNKDVRREFVMCVPLKNENRFLFFTRLRALRRSPAKGRFLREIRLALGALLSSLPPSPPSLSLALPLCRAARACVHAADYGIVDRDYRRPLSRGINTLIRDIADLGTIIGIVDAPTIAAADYTPSSPNPRRWRGGGEGGGGGVGGTEADERASEIYLPRPCASHLVYAHEDIKLGITVRGSLREMFARGRGTREGKRGGKKEGEVGGS
jgi:hypothetical protein